MELAQKTGAAQAPDKIRAVPQGSPVPRCLLSLGVAGNLDCNKSINPQLSVLWVPPWYIAIEKHRPKIKNV